MNSTGAELRYEDLGFGITCIDTQLQRAGLASCYLLAAGDELAFIDCGTGNSLPFFLQLLERKGLSVEQVRYVIPTHVHLDHAGGAGALMAHCPNAQLVVHPRGARHLIDPGKLEAGALAVYGQARFDRLFGKLQPIAAQRVIEAGEGFELNFNSRELRFLDTPGHARHHVCIHDPVSQGVFTGDTFGVSYPELNQGRHRFVFPPTTPTQFDPDAWYASIDRLLALKPERMYLTHYGCHMEPEYLGRELRYNIAEYVAIAEEFANHEKRLQRLTEELLRQARNFLLDQQCGLDSEAINELLAGDMQLNAQGLDYWLASRAV